MKLPTQENFAEIFLSGVPLMDTRAPVEYARGSFPGAVNLPLMMDDEREAVGTCYKEQGQEAAIELGHRLVSGAVRQERIAAWADFARQHPEGYLFCFRGGLRSQIVQRWLAEEAGVVYPRVAGGYKAMRHFLMQTTERLATTLPLYVVGGMTGTGKTELLQRLTGALDLEACANHRGSGFGRRVSAQPAQIDFEHRIATSLLALETTAPSAVVVEDEGHFIGRCSVPAALFDRMQRAPLLWLEDSFENRTQRILQDYVIHQRADHDAAFGEAGSTRFAAHLTDSLFRIRKRLGGERYERARALMDEALQIQAESGHTEGHTAWIALLLREYYDPMYVHQKAQKQHRMVVCGDADTLARFVIKF